MAHGIKCLNYGTLVSFHFFNDLKFYYLKENSNSLESDPVEEVQNKKSKSDLVSLTKVRKKKINDFIQILYLYLSFLKTPIITLAGHAESISSCKWMDEKNVCTASWDHSIKLWDMFTGQETKTLKSLNKIFLSVDYSPLSKLIAAGLNDNFVRIYDPRSNEGMKIDFLLI